MACGSNEYFVGNGSVMLRKMADNCGDPTEGWWEVGDASALSISNSQEFAEHYESRTGNRKLAARWSTQTSSTFSLTVSSFSTKALIAMLQGVDAGVTASATGVTHRENFAYRDGSIFVPHGGLSNVTVTEDPDGTPNVLVAGTDYEVDTRNGGIKILAGAPNLTGNGPFVLDVLYDHVGLDAVINALKDGISDYQVRFNGINLTAGNTPVIVELKRAQLALAEELSLINADAPVELTFTGSILADSNDDSYTITKVKSVA